ncbi:peptidase family m1 domain-containing protein [Phthorimaea operculella]|nr:peptidase family m1 domain-containing protein [Phthorimaea operculella]
MLLQARSCQMIASDEIASSRKVSESDQLVDYRLPRNILPKNYKLLLKPDMVNKTFEGTVAINVDILEPTRKISLHSHKLDINEVSLKNRNNQSIKVEYSLSKDKREFLFLSSKEMLALSRYTLEIKFSGRLDKRIISIYASTLKKGGQCLSKSLHSMSTTMEKPPLKVTISDRLSSLVQPVNYKLKLHPDLVTGGFKGSVHIDVCVKEQKNYIQLHTKFLDINDVKVYKGDQEVPVMKYLEVKQIEQLLIHFDSPLCAGKYQICVDFSGDLTRNIVGFYLSHLKNQGTMVASKFQPTYARQAFPCFDEPDFKATYDITLVKPTTHIALSNMNEVSKTIDKDTNLESVTFATSVPMSTYLACFVVCDFDFKETEINANGIGKNFRLRTFAQKDQMHKIDFALDIGKRATEYYVKYYEVPFPLPKLDMIAIPDYQSGATEHWGLITYRETSFLVDPATASASNKYSVANTIAHELAHMWFGNLVTLKWWDDLWLNEGFASYMQVKALNAIEPTWTMLELFLTKTLHSVLVTDAKLSSHPIVQTVDTPDQITAIFDAISYNKGASILRMLEGFIGEENFRKGVSDYLKKYEFGNTVTKDLLDMLEPYFKKNNPGLNLTYIMDTWTRQMGYPFLTVTKDDAPNTYVITQSRFLLDPDAKIPSDSPFDYRWFIPVTYTTNKGPSETILWFPNDAQSVKLTLKADETLLKINNNQVGYYRVNYPLDMWEALIQQLKSKSAQLTISDRAHLINEVFALAQSKRVSYELALNLTAYLTVEEDYVPWEAARSAFSYLSDMLMGTLAYDDLQKYIQTLVKPLYAKQSWEKPPQGVIERLMRVSILGLATRNQLPDAQKQVRSLFLNWLNNHGTSDYVQIEPDLRDLVYYHGMKSATLADWEKLWQVYLKEEDAHEQSKLRTALAAPRDSNILRRYLLLAWDEKNIRSQDYLTVIQLIAQNPSGAPIVWDDVRSRWPEFVDRFTLNSRYLGNMIPGITHGFNTELRLKENSRFNMTINRYLALVRWIVWDDVRSRWPEFVDRFTLNSRYLGNMIPGITHGFNTELRLKECLGERAPIVWDDVRSRWPKFVDRFTLNSRYLGNMIPGITHGFNTELRLKENPLGVPIVWDDVRSRWPRFVDRFTLNSRYLGNMIPGITHGFNTELRLKEMETFFSEYPDAGAGEAARRRALETVRNNIRWIESNQKPVADWLAAHTS